MSIASVAIEKRTVTTFVTAVLLAAGLASYFGLGQLEDPEFTVKTAAVMTPYPGATAAEVELEVTDRIELAVQEMSQVKELESFSRAGLSLVKVYIEPSYQSDELPQIWDELRKKVRDVRDQLPPGTGTPIVGDDYGDVYGFFMAIVGDGFTDAELERHVDRIKKEVSLVPGVSRVSLWGVQASCVHVQVSEARLSQLGLSMESIRAVLVNQNAVVNAGGVDIVDERLRVEVTGEFTDPRDIADLVIRGRAPGSEDDQRLIRLGDIAEIHRGYLEPPVAIMRSNGRPAIGMAISNTSGVNVVDVGRAIDVRMAELLSDLPVGIEVDKISWQSDQVSASIRDFMVSLAEAVAIVLFVLWIAMGWRTALVVGLSGLLFTIIVSFLFMKIFGIDLQRMSLGALIVAMGMMVDNAIVVADGILVRIQRGMDRTKAAIEAATQPSVPLLGATVVAVMAFYPIAASDEGAGEYCATLFSVVGISLVISWVLSVTVAPVMCIAMLPAPREGAHVDPYGGRFYRIFRGGLERAIRVKWLVVLAMIAALGVSLFSFRWVESMFFPASARTQFMIDYWAPEGTRIQQVSSDLRVLESKLLDDGRVSGVSTFIGQGPPRFYLPVDPESPYQSYGQLIVNTHDDQGVVALLDELQPWVEAHVPQALVVLRKYGLGPSETWQVQARFSGPAIADPQVLRALGEQATAIMQDSPHNRVARTNWRQRSKKVVADFDETNARWTSVAREHLAVTTLRAYDGLNVGLYREEDKLLPIVLRNVPSERARIGGAIDSLQVRPPFSDRTVPLSQVTSSINIEWEDPLIWRWDRRRALTVQAVPMHLAETLRSDVAAEIEAIPLPPGYELSWDGEYLSSKDAQASLVPGVIPAVAVMAIIVVGLFNAYRPPIIIVSVIPFAMIGVTVGLLVTRQPFGFVALLGAMSLAGMMIKNAIVLLDQINIEIAAGKSRYDAVIESALSRLRPVMLAAGTTVLGVIPLLQDVFWIAMAVTIMFGLALGSVLTVVLVPVLYACFFKLEKGAAP